MYREYEIKKNLQKIIADSNDAIVERIKKLNKLQELRIKPYPYNYKHISHTKDILDNFENIKEVIAFPLIKR